MIDLVADELLPSYAIGDVPSGPLTLTPDTEDTWTGVSVDSGTAVLDGPAVKLTLPPLDTAGILTLTVTLTGSGGAIVTCEPVRIIVEDPASGWLSLSRARAEWADAPEDNVSLYGILEPARTACEEFAPAVETVPAHYLRAQLLQAQGIWNSGRATNANQIGDGETAVTVWPLDWNVKQLLRPKSALPGMY